MQLTIELDTEKLAEQINARIKCENPSITIAHESADTVQRWVEQNDSGLKLMLAEFVTDEICEAYV